MKAGSTRISSVGIFWQKLMLTALMAMVFTFPLKARAQVDQSMTICTTLFSQGVNDVHNVYSDEQHFERFKDILRSLNIRTYSDLRREAVSGSLGLSLPELDDLLGLDASAEVDSSSSTFSNEYAKFLNSTWSDVSSRAVTSEMNSTISNALLAVYKDCEEHYFAAVLSAARQVVTIIPENPPSSFLMRVEVAFPSGVDQKGLRINQVAPRPDVNCSINGRSVVFPYQSTSNQALFTCTKPPHKSVAVLIQTNAGVPAAPIVVPAQNTAGDNIDARLASLETQLQGVKFSSPPIGSIIAYGGEINEQQLKALGWLPCDGRRLSITESEYGKLFAVIQRDFGGDATTFIVPDLRGVFLRGVDGGAGRDPDSKSRSALYSGQNAGDKVGSYQPDQVGPHTHPAHDKGHDHPLPDGLVMAAPGGYQVGTNSAALSDSRDHHPHTAISYADVVVESNNTSETRPKNVDVNYLIRYK